MPLLWKPESWSQRLAELEARSGDLKEAPLRRDVRSLGMLLGEVLREQAGEALYEKVEELRQSAIRRREEQTTGSLQEAEDRLQQTVLGISTLSVEDSYQLSRAFAFYFELINLAETNHRKRRRLSLQLSGDNSTQRGSLRGTLREMKRVGISAAEALDWLRRIFIVPVFTAHPTEIARRSVLFKRRRIGEFLEKLDRIPVPDEEISRLQEQLIAEITALWQTDEVRSRRPTVNDEIKMGLDYYDVSIFATLPKLYEEVSTALASEYGLNIDIPELPLLLGFGSWIGGDRDGNPFVTPDVTREAIRSARARLLAYYQQQAQLIIDLLTTSAQQLPISDEFSRRLHGYLSELRAGSQQVFGARFEFELYRRFMVCVHARLLQTSGEPPPDNDSLEATLSALPSYGSAQELLDDLTALRNSLTENEGLRLARTLIDPFILLVRTFGLHLHTLDVRQHVKLHNKALQETSEWCSGNAASVPQNLSKESADVIDSFRTIAEVKAGCSPEAIRQYVISGAATVEDVLGVLWLARLGRKSRGQRQ